MSDLQAEFANLMKAANSSGTNSLTAAPLTKTSFLGMGYDPRTNTGRNQVVVDNSDNKKNPNIEPDYKFGYIENYSELSNFLSVSLSAAYGASGGAGGSASLTMMRSTVIKQSSVFVALKMRIITMISMLKTYNLTGDALQILKKQTLPQFVEKFGSRFVSSLYHGGELACVMEFTFTSVQTMEAFRAELKGHAIGANGSAAAESLIRSLTTSKNVKIAYAQSGGTVGMQEGIFVKDADELITRMQKFAREVVGGAGVEGSTVPLYADFASLLSTLNWPPEITHDPASPYPPEIDNIAKSILLLNEKLVVVEGILQSTALLAPSVREAATALKPYLSYAIDESSKALGKMMSDATAKIELKVESFYQFRIRNKLGVSASAPRDNAGPNCDMTEPDKNLLGTWLFGKEDVPVIKPWPQLEYRGEKWGYMGELDNAFAPFNIQPRVNCPDQGGSSAESIAWLVAGSPPPNSGIFTFVDHHPVHLPGNHCGYHILHFAKIIVKQPDKSLLPPLPSLPLIGATKPDVIINAPQLLGPDQWSLSFTVPMTCLTSCGRYNISIVETLKNDASKTRNRTETSYWYKENEKNLALSHPVSVEQGWAIKSFAVEVDEAYCRT